MSNTAISLCHHWSDQTGATVRGFGVLMKRVPSCPWCEIEQLRGEMKSTMKITVMDGDSRRVFRFDEHVEEIVVDVTGAVFGKDRQVWGFIGDYRRGERRQIFATFEGDTGVILLA